MWNNQCNIEKIISSDTTLKSKKTTIQNKFDQEVNPQYDSFYLMRLLIRCMTHLM